MARFIPTDVLSSYSSVAALNANFDDIAALLERVVFRDGTASNSMLADLDLNHFKIQNVADGVAETDAVNVGQVTELVETYAGALPSVSERAGQYLAFDADGQMVASSGTGADAGLRTDLATNGAHLVGTADGLLSDVLAARKADALANEAFDRQITSRDLSPIVVPMHFGIMLGQGWVAGDPGDGASQKASTLAGAVAAGAISLTVASGTFFVDGQLIAYCTKADDTDPAARWHTVRVSTKAGTTLTLDRPLPAAAESGAKVGVFFNDFNHPREYASYAIADRLLDDYLASKRRLALSQHNYDDWAPYAPAGGSPTLSPITALDYQTPGSDYTYYQAVKVASDVQYNGAQSLPVDLPAGNYEAVLIVNPGNVGGARNTIQVFVEEEFPGNVAIVSATVVVSGLNGNQRIVIPFNKSSRSRVRIYAQGMVAGSSTFSISGPRYYRVAQQSVADLTDGTWVALGDSWFYNPWILDRIEDRSPNLTLVRKGVAGNNSADLLARFASDVEPYNPRVVLINCSTNDYAAGVSQGLFNSNMRKLIRMCEEIGAQPILFDATVGDAATAAQLQNSRLYASSINYEESAEGDRQVVVQSQWHAPITIAPGAKVALMVSPAATSRGVVLDGTYAVSDGAVFLEIGFTGLLTPPAGALENELAFGGITSFEMVKQLVPKTVGTSTRYFMVVAHNTGATPFTIDRYQFRARMVEW